MKIFDTHAHYSDGIYDEDRKELFRKMYSEGVTDITLISADIESLKKEKSIVVDYADKTGIPKFYFTVGDHPDEIPKYSPDSEEGFAHIDELNKLCKVKNHIEAVAIGEIGLDYYGDHKTEGDYKNQKEWFIAEIELAKKLNLPLVIHSRDACKDTLDMIREYAKGMAGILHCFSYEKEIAIEYIKLGFYIGVGGVVTFKNGKKLKEVVSAIPIERIVTETDAPWLTPTPYRGKRNESTYIKYVISEIANIKSIDESAAASTLYQNAIDVYNLH